MHDDGNSIGFPEIPREKLGYPQRWKLSDEVMNEPVAGSRPALGSRSLEATGDSKCTVKLNTERGRKRLRNVSGVVETTAGCRSNAAVNEVQCQQLGGSQNAAETVHDCCFDVNSDL